MVYRPSCQDFGRCFEDEMIDGEAFLLLNQTDLVTHLGIKLGPAVRIYNSILVIRDNIEA
uniref:SAM domain-containing protein n=1 Tax=Tetranychus urticae TaxID=32264 RepID=T1L059_TETUR